MEVHIDYMNDLGDTSPAPTYVLSVMTHSSQLLKSPTPHKIEPRPYFVVLRTEYSANKIVGAWTWCRILDFTGNRIVVVHSEYFRDARTQSLHIQCLAFRQWRYCISLSNTIHIALKMSMFSLQFSILTRWFSSRGVNNSIHMTIPCHSGCLLPVRVLILLYTRLKKTLKM